MHESEKSALDKYKELKKERIRLEKEALKEETNIEDYWETLKLHQEDYYKTYKKYSILFNKLVTEKVIEKAKAGLEKNKTKSYKGITKWVAEKDRIKASPDLCPGLLGNSNGKIFEKLACDILDKYKISYMRAVKKETFADKNTNFDKKIDILIPLKKKANKYIIIYCQKNLLGGGAQTDRIHNYMKLQPLEALREGHLYINLQWDLLSFVRESKHFKSLCNPKRVNFLMYLDRFEKYIKELKSKGEI